MKKKKTAVSASVLAIELCFLILSFFVFSARLNAPCTDTWFLINCVASIVGLAILVILATGVLFDRTPLTEGTLLLLTLFLVTGISLLGTVIFWCVNGIPRFRILNQISNYIQLLTSPALILLYWLFLISYLDLSSKQVSFMSELLKIFCIFDMIYILSNALLGHIFVLNENAGFISGPFMNTILIYPLMGLACIIFMLLMQDLSFRQRTAFIMCILLPVSATLITRNSDAVSITYVCNVLSVTLLYLSLFVERGRELLLSQAELSRQKMTVMASQIQPHFLYNALTAIMSIPGNPPETKEALSDFSSYLRCNLNVLKQSNPIPFPDELNHTKHYLHLEKLRFEDDLQIEYDIQAENFLVPALSVQMLAENAVKHGITAKEDGGTLFIGTRETENEFIVIVKDDGLGFTQEALDGKRDADGRIHIGLENIDNRIRDMVGGIMEIRSQRGSGTEVTLRFPKSGQPSGN